MRTARLGLVVAVAVLMGILAPVAGATDYCVAPNMDCGANNKDTLEKALAAAATATDADRILLGDGTYTAPTVVGYRYNP